jgi:hypothetical protein
MQSFTGPGSSRPRPRCSGLLGWAIHLLTGRDEMVECPSPQWAEVSPIDFEGEDTSLTQAHLELLR